MQFKRRLKKEAAIDLTSLVDIVFLLLLFFVVTTTFRESPGLEIELPETRESAGLEVKDLVINIVPTDDGATFYLGEDQVGLDDLESRLRNMLQDRPADKRAVVVQADKNVRYEMVFRVFDIARDAGASGISLPAEFRPDETPPR